MVDKKVSGRRLALQCLDNVIEEHGSIEILAEGFRNSLRESPVDFFKTVILPTIPKETLIQLETPDSSQLRIEFVAADPKEVIEQPIK